MKPRERFSYLCMIYITLQPVVLAEKVEASSQVTGYIGYNVTLPCNFNKGTLYSNVTQSQWDFQSPDGNTTRIMVSNKLQGKHVHESHLKGRVDMEDQSLQIQNVEISDEGSYVCTVSTFPDGSHSVTTKLHVQVLPPELKLISSSWFIYVITSGFLVLLLILSATAFFFYRRRDSANRGDEHKQVKSRPSKNAAKKEEVVYSGVKIKKTRDTSSSNTKHEDSAQSDHVIYSQVNVFHQQNE
ncbi:hypothetical protein OJAV_G00161780 [Oryzias javanicus]|uniref:Ig-like domain-containing protein n=1 Tax=Oryzias javanicus TaxID=123683 RepID=A0A3S2NZ64_ORYJA|nr:hypothetical protein OJAV_G00161780 [Oryzias javanicus]